MILMVSSTGKTVESSCDPRFGRCQFFVKYDTDKKVYEFIENTGISANHGAGIAAAQVVVDQKVDYLLTGNLGPKAFQVVSGAGIKAFRVEGVSVGEAVEQFDVKTGELIQVPGMSLK